jgi:hypothetical protein
MNTVLCDTNNVEKHFYDIQHNPLKLPRITKQYKYNKMQFIELKKQYCTFTSINGLRIKHQCST